MANPYESEPDETGGRLSDDDVARLSDQIAGLTSAGLPLAPGLRATAEEMPRGRLRSALESLVRSLERGATVAEAVAAEGDRLPRHLRGLILIGAKTGRTSQVLGRFVAFSQVGAELRRGLRLSLAYPIFALLLSAAIMVLVSSTVVGTFESLFRDFGVNLPGITIAILNVSRVFAMDLATAAELAVALLVLLVLPYVLMSGPVRRSLGGGVPVLGSVWRNTSLAEFSHLLALLLESRVPLPEALRLTGDGVCDHKIDRACGAMGDDVERGLTLSQAVLRRPVFPRGMARVLHWAEGHQSLPEALHMAGEMFEASARSQAKFAGTVLAVVAAISIISSVAVLVVGLLVPLISLIVRLSG